MCMQILPCTPNPPPRGQGAQNGHFHNHENFWVPHVLVFSMVINLLQSFEILQNLAAYLGPVLALFVFRIALKAHQGLGDPFM